VELFETNTKFMFDDTYAFIFLLIYEYGLEYWNGEKEGCYTV